MSAASKNPTNYHSFLVRLRRANTTGSWWAEAQCSATRRVFQFNTLDELFAFLIEETASDEFGAAGVSQDSAT